MDATSLLEGAVFHDQYEVVRRIDSGAMGTVYEVIDRRTRRRRALKIMLARFADNPEVTERFRREATITADVVSEHVVETYDAGVDQASGLPFLVMELLRGEDLGKIVARGPLPYTDVVMLLMQAASALDKMHAAGIIHRDLKPENLFVTRRDDGAPRLKILDFGIAKVIEKSAPSATTTRNMGTPVYMSPEQVTGAGHIAPHADLYAIGHLAYAMLVGEPYWLEDALAHETVYPLLLRIMEGVIEAASVRALRTRNVTLPPAFDPWFARAAAHDPEARFANAAESIVALAEALSVPRPKLPSWFSEAALSNATTEAPPGSEDGDEEAFPLVPPPARLPKQDEALRTLSPVSTLPEESQPTAPARSAEPKRRLFAVVGLGAAFFLIGVIGAVMIARPRTAAAPPPERIGISEPPALPPTEPLPPTATQAPIATASAVPEPSASALLTPTAAATASAPSSASASATVHPSKTAQPVTTITTTRRPTKPAGKPTSSPQRPYGDPSRDL